MVDSLSLMDLQNLKYQTYWGRPTVWIVRGCGNPLWSMGLGS